MFSYATGTIFSDLRSVDYFTNQTENWQVAFFLQDVSMSSTVNSKAKHLRSFIMADIFYTIQIVCEWKD